eukprot:10361585-Alexandrium_andersonii.AAC.1
MCIRDRASQAPVHRAQLHRRLREVPALWYELRRRTLTGARMRHPSGRGSSAGTARCARRPIASPAIQSSCGPPLTTSR